jgi:hypothetical protein
MCPPSRKPSPPPAPEPIPQAPPVVSQPPAIVESKATTTRKAPREARPTTDTATAPSKTGEPIVKKKKGRSSLRIPLLTTGLSNSGLNFPSP